MVNGISIHASNVGCDVEQHNNDLIKIYFNPRIQRTMQPPLRNTPYYHTHFNPRIQTRIPLEQAIYGALNTKFQSTHPMKDATRADTYFQTLLEISIHASNEGCDACANAKEVK